MSQSLGRSLVKAKAKARKLRSKHDGDEWVHVKAKSDSKAVQSVTDESSLDEFLAKAQLAGTEFTAERNQANTIVVKENLGFMSPGQIEESRLLQEENRSLLKLPRRPPWDSQMTAKDLDKEERDAFLEWRRQLAQLQQIEGLVLTPFERNLELWRQLWRVLERSDVVAQIVDARNPLLFRSEDMETYVKEMDSKKINFLILNKADLLTESQRMAWAQYFQSAGVRSVFWSALDVKPEKEDEDSSSEFSSEDDSSETSSLGSESKDKQGKAGEILTTSQLLDVMRSLSDELGIRGRPAVIGMVGYPNVGKSSSINQLMGLKKVPVSITPGKTRHFQTLFIDEALMLCDCPGLVMPSFALSREEMIVNGILPVNQMRGSSMPPIALLCSRFPKRMMEDVYGVVLPSPPEGQEKSSVNAQDLVTVLAFSRGFMSSKGIPDTSRAARIIVNDVINGKLTWAAAPPGTDQQVFDQFPENSSKSDTSSSVELQQLEKRNLLSAKPKTDVMDNVFFGNMGQVGAHAKGKSKAKEGTKKHFNKNKKEKLRRVYRDLDA